MNDKVPFCEVIRREEGPKIDVETFVDDLSRHFYYTLGRDKVGASRIYLYQALVLSIRDQLISRWRASRDDHRRQSHRQVAYLSLEFLMGRSLNNAMLNLDLEDKVRQALQLYCCELEEVETAEHDAGLGNGGLGRLAACFMDSCASLGLPVTGYGIRYEYGMFNQAIENGNQIEQPDNWLREDFPWEIKAPDDSRRIKFFGRVEVYEDKQGRKQRRWVDTRDVLAVPYDVPVPGFRNNIVNTLRLWKSEATDEFNLSEFNAGSYSEAVGQKNLAEQITMVLYPNDSNENGKELRLRQQYFLSSATLQDILAEWVDRYGADFVYFSDLHVFQLNDTHPSIAVAELMRLLIDDYNLTWQVAWNITTATMAYTNHTLLPEALEKWPVWLFQRLLPRLLEIIYEINARFLQEVALKWPGDVDKQVQMSIIEEGDVPQVRMAHLAIVGSFSVNGVAELHTRLLREGLFNHFDQLWPNKFNNKTNGVTPRRWLHHCNPVLSQLISEKIGTGWVADFSQIKNLAKYHAEPAFQQQWQKAKLTNKQRLAALVKEATSVEFDPAMLFDVQVKRIHEYKRQLLNILHVIHRYDRILKGDTANMVPRCVLIGGKAAPGYFLAKCIIKLISNVAATINLNDAVRPFLRVAFFPNYNVTAMEKICPGTDLSEQISTAGKEASGTGNMKFMMNGGLTIGTLDGANVEMLESVGAENFFLFGARTDQLSSIFADYSPDQTIASTPSLQAVLQLIESGHFSLFEPGIFQPIIDAIRSPTDPWLTAYDFASYVEAQEQVDLVYQDQARWTSMSILNTAASGPFSSDRTIREYSDKIWNLELKK